MKHHAHQFELPGADQAFNLAGQTARQPEVKPAAKPDNTRDMFYDSAVRVWYRYNPRVGVPTAVHPQPESPK